MIRLRSLRSRLCCAFGLLGVLLAALFAAGVWMTAEGMEEAFLDATLSEELDYFIEEWSRSPQAVPPQTASVRGYAVADGDAAAAAALPAFLRTLAPGRHELTAEGTDYEIAVVDADGHRFYLAYDEARIQAVERTLIAFLAVSSLLVVALSALLGWFAADRITAPVRDLAASVRRIGLDAPGPEFAAGARGIDEVTVLAETLDAAVGRLHGFLAREREFTAEASHQLRTSAAVIMSTVELMQSDPPEGEPQRRRLDRLALAASHLSRQIEAFLLLSREPEGDTTAGSSVAAAVEGLIAAEHAYSPNVERRLRLSVDGEEEVAAPAAALEIVVGNLMHNALAHGDGPVTVRVGGGEVTVHDEGPSIPAETLAHVFERGFRGPTSAEGTGLGLTIARRICERYGWEIDLESGEGLGTTARVRFAT